MCAQLVLHGDSLKKLPRNDFCLFTGKNICIYQILKCLSRFIEMFPLIPGATVQLGERVLSFTLQGDNKICARRPFHSSRWNLGNNFSIFFTVCESNLLIYRYLFFLLIHRLKWMATFPGMRSCLFCFLIIININYYW